MIRQKTAPGPKFACSFARQVSDLLPIAPDRYWYGDDHVSPDFLFQAGLDLETVPMGWLTDPQIAPSATFRVDGSHVEFLWRLMPPGLQLPAEQLSDAAFVLANSFLKALGATSAPSEVDHLSKAVATHAKKLDGLRTANPAAYDLLIQVRLGQFIDQVPRAKPHHPQLRLARNHALFMAMHAAKIVGMLSGNSLRRPMPSLVGSPGVTIKVGGSIRALTENFSSISKLLAGLPTDLLMPSVEHRTIYNNGLHVAGVDVMPLAREMELRYQGLEKAGRKKFRRELGRIVAQYDRFGTAATVSRGRKPLITLFGPKQIYKYRPNAMMSKCTGHTEFLKMWTGFSAVEAVAAASISLALAFDKMQPWITTRYQVGRLDNLALPVRVWPKRLPRGSVEIAFSTCEVLRCSLTRDKDSGLKIRKNRGSVGEPELGHELADGYEHEPDHDHAEQNEPPVRSSDAGRTAVKKARGMLTNPNGPDARPVTVQPDRWLYPDN